jgi:Ca-activated chloride channel family protein
MNAVVNFARLVVERSDPQSEIFVERFVGPDRIVLMQDFTTRRAALGRALDDMYVEGGQSAITDALYLAAEHMAQRKDEGQPPRRRALVLITDGEDRANAHSVEEVVAKLRGSDVQVFVLGLTKVVKLQVGSPEKAIAYLNRIAHESGGALYLPDKNANLVDFAEQIIAELNAPYTLSYAPTNQKRDGSTRKLAVTVADAPDGQPRRVVFRTTYVAPKK